MKINLFVAILALVIASCSSNLSKNLVQEGRFVLRNGTFANKEWKEDLVFKRSSWYHELTLQFDFMLADLSPQSSFNFWLSKEELGAKDKCIDFKIVLAYSLDTTAIPFSSLYEQLDAANFKRIELTGFKKYFLSHPDSELNSLKLYHVFGLCSNSKGLNSFPLNFPGHLETYINK